MVWYCRFWPRERDPESLLFSDVCPVPSTLKVERNPTTGELLGYNEVIDIVFQYFYVLSINNYLILQWNLKYTEWINDVVIITNFIPHTAFSFQWPPVTFIPSGLVPFTVIVSAHRATFPIIPNNSYMYDKDYLWAHMLLTAVACVGCNLRFLIKSLLNFKTSHSSNKYDD